MKTSLLSVLGLGAVVSARTITVTNKCAYTVWPAHYTGPNGGSGKPNYPAGWEAKPDTFVSFTVPDDWKAGRIWGRRGCNFTSGSGAGSCLTGGCDGGLVCDASTGTASGPVTVAEFSFGVTAQDFFDVSIVDGFNVPMSITNTQGCANVDCPVDLNIDCPAPLRGPIGDTGSIVGCKSACLANVDGTPQDSSNCCTGSHNTPATCPKSSVAYYDFFKGRCPKSYAFAYDETPHLLVCPSSQKVNYAVTFCP